MSNDIAPTKPQDDKNTYIVVNVEKRNTVMSTFISLVIIAWIVAGISAHLTAFACLGGSGFWQNIYGLLIAILFGPMYFAYLYLMKGSGYCYYGRS